MSALTVAGRVVSARRDLQARLELLRERYEQLPTVACQGLCASSCDQHVWASDIEAHTVEQLGVDLAAPTATGACPALRTNPFGQQRCAVHADRPMICRLWGVAEAMPCPHGCVTSTAPLADLDALEALLKSFAIGGADLDVEGMRRLFGRASADPRAAELLAGILRGDRDRTAELARFLTSEAPGPRRS